MSESHSLDAGRRAAIGRLAGLCLLAGTACSGARRETPAQDSSRLIGQPDSAAIVRVAEQAITAATGQRVFRLGSYRRDSAGVVVQLLLSDSLGRAMVGGGGVVRIDSLGAAHVLDLFR
jgi:hypothetical protein